MKRILSPAALVLAMLSLAVSLWTSVHRARVPVPAPVAPHTFGTSPPSYAYYDNLRQTGQYWVTDPVYGAKCDGATDDTAAFNAAEAARAAVGGHGWIPPATCIVSSMIAFGSGASWSGTPGVSTIKASATAPSVVSVTGSSGVYDGIIFDGHRQTNHAVLLLGATQYRFTGCQFNNALVHGVRKALASSETYGSVTQTGGGPSIAVSALDQYFSLPQGPNQCLKITTGGALGTATFAVSFFGCGGTFGNNQTLFAKTQIGSPASTTFATGTGILLTASAGTYVLNTTYAFTASAVTNSNNYVTYEHCQAYNDGIIYMTSGFEGDYGYPTCASPGQTYNCVLAAGTIAVTSGNTIAIGTGTSFLTGMPGLLDGDMLRVSGHRIMISAALSDTQLQLDNGNIPTFTVSGVDYGIAVGAGWSEDVDTGNQYGSLLEQCSAISCATGMRFSGLSGPTLVAPHIIYPAISALTIGTYFSD